MSLVGQQVQLAMQKVITGKGGGEEEEVEEDAEALASCCHKGR